MQSYPSSATSPQLKSIEILFIVNKSSELFMFTDFHLIELSVLPSSDFPNLEFPGW